jgi:N-acetyldiaminopimelate deacetylase
MILNPIELRNVLHKNPEISFKEIETTKLLIENINSISDSLIIKTPLETGLLVEYKVNSGDYLLFRADVDALPIKEMTDFGFKSVNEYMHACGHDVHTAILYGFLQWIVQNKVKQNILFLFQPGEEEGAGAKKIMDSGILSEYHIISAFSLHVTDEYPYGSVASCKGSLFASSLELDIDFTGRIAHITEPEKGINVLHAVKLFLDEAEMISIKQKDKILFGIGKITAGEARNIIPGHAHIETTIRGIDLSAIAKFMEELYFLSVSVSRKTKSTIKFIEGKNYPNVIINDKLYDIYKPIISTKFKWIDCEITYKAEDYGYYSHVYPAFYFWLGTQQNESYGLHSPYFLPPNSIIDVGIDIYKLILENIT